MLDDVNDIINAMNYMSCIIHLIPISVICKTLLLIILIHDHDAINIINRFSASDRYYLYNYDNENDTLLYNATLYDNHILVKYIITNNYDHVLKCSEYFWKTYENHEYNPEMLAIMTEYKKCHDFGLSLRNTFIMTCITGFQR